MDQVVIAGAGPVGLWLAAELRLGGIPVTVLESRLSRNPHSKALGMQPRTIEVLAMRGLDGLFTAEARRIPNGHFGMLDTRLDFRALDTDFPYQLVIPQARTEELLEERAAGLGATIRRGHQVTSVEDTGSAVVVHASGPDGPYSLEAAYVVGCDGVHSTVRQSVGIDFPGTAANAWGWLADVTLDAPPAVQGYNRSTADGAVLVAPLPDGRHRVVGMSPSDLRASRPDDLTMDEVRAKIIAATGTDFGAHSPVWLSRFGNAANLAAEYRRGRVFLAGDAAHRHMPAGGVGMNVGIQDAMNLGWKLAAVLNGSAPASLLDTYHAERHPVGVELLESTQAQTALICSFTPDGLQLRSLMSRQIAQSPEFSRQLAEQISGLSVRYPASEPLAGTRAPNLKFRDGTTLFERLTPGRPVRIDHSELAEDWAGVRSALIRPDGYVASPTMSMPDH
ncbi:FAD-dependent monooxygenase [Kibdelosporangium persicum]|uniref:FAD-dependent oxidoreductase n=1 Tax=Kibdelosporangium persicum TaxID=2698649 RepID=A0ABX2F033_9PSEU|nr:FAD-dependent monooxygenase [Kibdelosporangium persicum]NRN64676.1 FAD-dependent oxidoreductase [Kibdelosporangium persicum]